jgi:hypothetical protein
VVTEWNAGTGEHKVLYPPRGGVGETSFEWLALPASRLRWPWQQPQLAACAAALAALRALTDGATGRCIAPPFERLPTREELPIYYERISKPVDLQAVEAKLTSCQYADVTEFCDALHTMFDNALAFNGMRHPLGIDAQRLREAFVRVGGRSGALLYAGTCGALDEAALAKRVPKKRRHDADEGPTVAKAEPNAAAKAVSAQAGAAAAPSPKMPRAAQGIFAKLKFKVGGLAGDGDGDGGDEGGGWLVPPPPVE